MSLKIALENVYEKKLQRGFFDFNEQLVNFMLKIPKHLGKVSLLQPSNCS